MDVSESLHEQGRLTKILFLVSDTLEEEDKFYKDAHALTQDIIKPNASYGPISALLNIHAVFVPSNEVSQMQRTESCRDCL